MAGQPKTRRTMHEIERKIAALSADLDADGDADAWIFAQVEQGQSFTRIARKLGTSRQMLDKWIKRVPGRKERLKEAKRESAHALIDEAAEDLARLSRKAKTERIESAEVQLVNAQVNFKKWLAGQRNDEYKETQQVQVQTSGDLHFLLVQRLGNMPARSTTAEEIEHEDRPVLSAQIAEDEQQHEGEQQERDDLRELFED